MLCCGAMEEWSIDKAFWESVLHHMVIVMVMDNAYVSASVALCIDLAWRWRTWIIV